MIKRLYLDTETNSGAIEGDITDVWCIGLAVDDGDPFIITENYKQVVQSYIDDGYVPVMHNASFDLKVLDWLGVKVGTFHDSMLVHYLVAPTESHSLASLGEKLGYPKLESTPFDLGYTPEMGEYCKRDVQICKEAFKYWYELLRNIPNLLKLYYSIELPFVRCIIDMERNGVHVDTDQWRTILSSLDTQSIELHKQLAEVPPQIGRKSKTKKPRPDEQVSTTPELGKWCPLRMCEEDGTYQWGMWEPFNPASPVHVKSVLGLDKSDKEALEECDNPIAKLILEIRKVDKLLTTYGETMLAKVKPDGRLHGSYNQTVTRTGRLSSSNPNLRN